MSYGWAAIFTVGAWLVGGFLDGLLGSGALGLNTLFAIIAMGCCIMKFIKEASDKPCSHSKNRCPTVTHRNYSLIKIAFTI